MQVAAPSSVTGCSTKYGPCSISACWKFPRMSCSGGVLLVEEGRTVGHTFSQPDLIIADPALQHGLTVVTRDTGDYKLARVRLLNPWVAES